MMMDMCSVSARQFGLFLPILQQHLFHIFVPFVLMDFLVVVLRSDFSARLNSPHLPECLNAILRVCRALWTVCYILRRKFAVLLKDMAILRQSVP